MHNSPRFERGRSDFQSRLRIHLRASLSPRGADPVRRDRDHDRKSRRPRSTRAQCGPERSGADDGGAGCAVRVVGERRLTEEAAAFNLQLYQNGNKEKCPSIVCSAAVCRGSLTFTCTYPFPACCSSIPTFSFSVPSTSSTWGHSQRWASIILRVRACLAPQLSLCS